MTPVPTLLDPSTLHSDEPVIPAIRCRLKNVGDFRGSSVVVPVRHEEGDEEKREKEEEGKVAEEVYS